MDDAEILRARRRGYWMRRAREHAGFTLAAAAHAAGLAETSGSTVSLWETGARDVKLVQLERLAEAYGVPISLFTEPAETDDERLDRVMRDASEKERRDWEAGRGREGGDAPGDAPGTRSD